MVPGWNANVNGLRSPTAQIARFSPVGDPVMPSKVVGLSVTPVTPWSRRPASSPLAIASRLRSSIQTLWPMALSRWTVVVAFSITPSILPMAIPSNDIEPMADYR